MKDSPLGDYQYNLRGMLLLIAAIGVVFGIGIWAGLGFASFILVVSMAVFAGKMNGWKRLLVSDTGIIWWGAVVASLSVFFTYVYGPMGGRVTYLALFKNISLSWSGLGYATLLTPFFLAPMVGLGAFAGLSNPSSATVSRCRLGAVYVVILFATIVNVSAIIKFRGFIPNETVIMLHYTASITVLTAALLIVTSRRITNKTSSLHILLAVYALCYLYPISSSGNLIDTLSSYGPAYWMLVLGHFAILSGGVLGVAIWPCPPQKSIREDGQGEENTPRTTPTGT